MLWLRLPEPRRDIAPAFSDAESAQAWLGKLAPALPLAVFSALLEQIQAIDGAAMPAAQAIALLNLLRAAAVPLQVTQEERFTRRALPMLADEERTFEITHQLWAQLGIAYLRRVPQCTPANRCLPLQRAATAFRMAEYCHFLAARTCPALLDHLLLSVLATAEVNGVLVKPLADPDFPQYGKGSISGQLAWAFLIRTIDPYHLTASQLPVVNRAFSRWRELVNFQEAAPGGRETYTLDLSLLFGSDLPEGVPLYLNLRSVAHKLAQRVKLLETGESPEALKLGRTLSAAAAIRLLKDLEQHLYPRKKRRSNETGEIELVFGAENAYAVLNNRILNPASGHGDSGSAVNYQRMAIFGRDQVSELPTSKKRLKVNGEPWTIIDGLVKRAPMAQASDSRLLSPCLVASHVGGNPRLGIMSSLQCDADGALSAQLSWYDDGVEAGNLKRFAPKGNKLVRVPAFLLKHSAGHSLILPADTGARLGIALELTDLSVEELIPTEVIEQGTNFVHLACKIKQESPEKPITRTR
ncbi:MAG: hypothetical protein WBM25_02165 [Azonexus sp.]